MRAAHTSLAAIQVDRVVVRGTGDAAAARRVADRLPAELAGALAANGGPRDEAALRRLIARAAAEARR